MTPSTISPTQYTGRFDIFIHRQRPYRWQILASKMGVHLKRLVCPISPNSEFLIDDPVMACLPRIADCKDLTRPVVAFLSVARNSLHLPYLDRGWRCLHFRKVTEIGRRFLREGESFHLRLDRVPYSCPVEPGLKVGLLGKKVASLP